MSTLAETYKKEVAPKLMQELGMTNILAVPRVTKIVVSSGVGRATQDQKVLDEVSATLSQITGQKPKTTKARKAIASFKVRQGVPIGVMVTLRGKRMNDFMARLLHVVLPRIRDFRGLSPEGFDAQGNFSLGLGEHIVFPEISPDKVGSLHGLQITIGTTAKTPKEGQALLAGLGFPFKKETPDHTGHRPAGS